MLILIVLLLPQNVGAYIHLSNILEASLSFPSVRNDSMRLYFNLMIVG
jgi:hypothetical protein